MTRPGWPRSMKRTTAAAYCDLTPAKFMAEVYAGRLPMPIELGDEDHWDRAALDRHLDELAGGTHNWEREQPGLAA